MTKLLLLAIFLTGLVGQFVRPVGDALEGKAYIGGALLSLVGYVLYAEVQRLNTAHEAQREGTGSLHATVLQLTEEVQQLNALLGPRAGEVVTPSSLQAEFQEALEVGGEVHLSALGFTGETFTIPLKTLLERIPSNAQRSVYVRVLLPDFTQPMDVPGLVRADGKVTDAAGFRQRLVRQIKDYETDLKSMVGRVQVKGWGTLSVEFRVMHISPSLKLYLINNDRAFEGIYDKTELRPYEYHSEGATSGEGAANEDRLLDLIGYDSRLTRWRWNDGERAREAIERRRELFDTYWNVARELSPSPR
ncbi:ATP/GTP-binding protein [Streptomyces sp. NPDC002156]